MRPSGAEVRHLHHCKCSNLGRRGEEERGGEERRGEGRRGGGEGIRRGGGRECGREERDFYKPSLSPC